MRRCRFHAAEHVGLKVLRRRPPPCAVRRPSMAAVCGDCLCVQCGSGRTRHRAYAAVASFLLLAVSTEGEENCRNALLSGSLPSLSHLCPIKQTNALIVFPFNPECSSPFFSKDSCSFPARAVDSILSCRIPVRTTDTILLVALRRCRGKRWSGRVDKDDTTKRTLTESFHESNRPN